MTRMIYQVGAWGKSYTLEGDFENPQSNVIFDGQGMMSSVEEYEVVMGARGTDLARAAMRHHLGEVATAWIEKNHPQRGWVENEATGERTLTVTELSGDSLKEVLEAIEHMHSVPAPTDTVPPVGTPERPVYTGLAAMDGSKVIDAGRKFLVGTERAPVFKQYRGRLFSAREVCEIYDATSQAAEMGLPLSQAGLPTFDIPDGLGGSRTKRVAMNRSNGTLYSLRQLESDLPSHRLHAASSTEDYALRVEELESTGLTTSDAQGAADVEMMDPGPAADESAAVGADLPAARPRRGRTR